MISHPIYSLRVTEAFEALETSPEGLSAGEVSARQALYGRNLLTEQPTEPILRKLLAHLAHPMALLLWAAGGLAIGIGDSTLGVVIWAVVLINGAASFIREYRASQAIAALQQMLPGYARVIRNKSEQKIPASEIIPGDVMVLAEGDNISADARVTEEYGLRINHAALTGESVPARKTADASLREGLSEVERPNLVFAGTSVVSGTGRAVVYATGMLTQFGRIAHLTQTVREEPSRLQRELYHLTRVISLAALVIGAIVLAVGAFDVGLGFKEALLLAIGIIVAALPEGLPATVTLSLAMAVQRLAQQGVLVKKLALVETLGNISVICTDKSGTLTQNQMTVRQVWVAGQRLSVSGGGYEPRGEFTPRPQKQSFELDLSGLLTAAVLCNNSRLTTPTPELPKWSCLGDQTEAALRVAGIKGGLNEASIEHAFPRVHEIPFDARRKRMSTIHRVLHSEASLPGLAKGQQAAFVKGAPREVLQLCTHILVRGQVQPLDEDWRGKIVAAIDEYAQRALRVLALAYREMPSRPGSYTIERVESQLTFLGLMAMMDPPRPEVAKAVQVCRQAGIRMVMITGDYGLTAESLARRIGMLEDPNPLILTGAELDELNDVELQTLLNKEVLFARMAPEHKLRLVAAFQARGDIVAVTGDGVNDAPALRKADVGVAMGLIGTDVAKEAADIILTDDNFASITTAIEEGRAVYDNLRKFITYIFSSNVPEILPFILTALLSPVTMPLALRVKQILAIDLGTDLFPALALGTEKPEPDVMMRPPRRVDQPLVDRGLLARAFLWLGLIEAGLCYAGFFFVYQWIDLPIFKPMHALLFSQTPNLTPSDQLGLAVTVFYAGVVMAQVGNAFACRTERSRGRTLGWLKNPALLIGIAIEVAILLGLVYFPPLAGLFEHFPIPLSLWLGLLAYPIAIYALDWLRKGILRWKEQPASGNGNGHKIKEVL
jgi:Ca2+-transporting ATPase